MMFGTIFDVAIGLILGWFIFPRPTWADNLAKKAVAKFPILGLLIKD
jgi:hypothetical protein